jgi:hypothetical protein
VAHTYNPSYSGGRDKEDHGLKPVWTNSSQDLISKIPNRKKVGEVTQGIGFEFKPWYHKKKKKKKKPTNTNKIHIFHPNETVKQGNIILHFRV